MIEPLAGPAAYSSQVLREEQLSPIAEIVAQAIRAAQFPGAVVLIGNQGKIVYRRAFGDRVLKPKKLPMTADTIFDIASLTKVIATTTAVMQLVEKGQVSLEDPVAKYWPEFETHGKEEIKVRHLLTHYSGLPPNLSLKPEWSGYEMALQKIAEERPISPPGTRFIYSDLNFVILGELIQRISGQMLDVYCSDHIFKPLGMKDTCFRPSRALGNRIAPTRWNGIGKVHDPTAYRMGGVAGHAGLFSTADDLSIFAQTLLDGGSLQNVQILSPLLVEKMTLPQSPPDKMPLRGLGWDIDSPFGSNRTELFPVGSYGHRGFTGTGIWIDPVSKTYIIILTNRVYPSGQGDAEPLRAQIISLVAEAMEPVSPEQVLASRPSLADYSEQMKSYSERLQTGIDVLAAKRFVPLAGLRVGLITNHSGLDSAGRRTLDLLGKAPGVKLGVIFSPEHGLSGEAEEKVPSSKEPLTHLPIYSLYGDILRPTRKMLKDLDALVFDIQDVGVRFYTYIATMGYAMEAAAEKGIPFYVLDRPNPITGSLVQGPILDKDLKSFTGYFPLPIRHGMTVGELAKMFNGENKIGAELQVIKMSGYKRTAWYDETGLPWVNPSPNLRTLTQIILYPGVAMVEGANVSVGRGTPTPFELLGAPWIDAQELTAYLNDRNIPGVRFLPVDFLPESDRFKKQFCHGVQVILINREELDSPALGLEIVSALQKLYPKDFQLDKTLPLIGTREVLQAIQEGQDPHSIVLKWQGPLEQFHKLRSKYLLY
ncbi:MAG: exo-beta-N-acetylmuramidase NamZ domain-containing protein [Thermodesulfobacteriota bacterium]